MTALPEPPPLKAETPDPVHLAEPTGRMRVWLGDRAHRTRLEADVRALSASGLGRAGTATGLGDIARRHELEVRVIPRVEDGIACLLVLFGKRLGTSRR
jgi:hypothetical protein